MSKNGRLPRIPTSAHALAAVTIASRFSGGSDPRYRHTNPLPRPTITTADMTNEGIAKNSPLTAATKMERTIISDTAWTIRPTSRPTVCVFTTISEPSRTVRDRHVVSTSLLRTRRAVYEPLG